MRIGFQGEPGAFSEEAALALFGDGTECEGFRTFDDLVEAVDTRAVTAGLIPCENAIYGSIARTYDLLAQHPGIRITDETMHHIVQSLIGLPTAKIETIERIISHPVALEQCRSFLRQLRNVQVEAVDDTAGAVRMVSELYDPRIAAIGPALAAKRYGVKIINPSVHDDIENVTRFFVIERVETAKPRRNLGRACIALDLPHQAGSLYQALGTVAERSLNLRSLVARPNRARPFEYTFYLEVDCPQEAMLAELLPALSGETRLLGWY
jgi:prephenate dehydratase